MSKTDGFIVDETAPAATATETAPAETGPRIIAVRNGKKGPGEVKVVIATPADAELVKAELTPTLLPGQEIVIRPMPVTVVKTFSEWKAEAEKANEAARLRAEAMASLTPEQRKVLGLA